MLEDLFTTVLDRRRANLTRESGAWPRSVPIASDLSVCARETALGILHWHDRPPFDESVLARFEQGRDQEPRVMAKLLTYGLEVVEQQRSFELRDRQGRVVLRGKIDGKIKWNGRKIPFDVKTVNPLVFQRLHTVDDLLRHPYFQKWPRQLWAYEYLDNTDLGFLLLDNLLGEWRFIEVPLDYNEMEAILRRCETAVEAVEHVQRHGQNEAAMLPPFHTDAEVCRRCWAFGRVCAPPVEYAGLETLEDPGLEAKLDRRAVLQATAKEYADLDEDIKMRLRDRPRVVIGRWLITGQEQIRHTQARAASESRAWIMKILPLAGIGQEHDDTKVC